VENHRGGDYRQTGKLAWRRGWQINLAGTPPNWKITMAVDKYAIKEFIIVFIIAIFHRRK
jgi:hypothetical protein